ncbi:PAS fold domain protein [Candidatus Zixiibacteriota bacterium]|nr:PAS fold domain protein [candidate division Zixibacteria bacterium]
MNTAPFEEINAAVTICDTTGIIIYMNKKAVATFAADGGADLIGKNLFDCHSDESIEKLKDLIAARRTNAYTIEKNGVKKLIYQTPWYDDDSFGGLIEFSFEIPFVIPHFIRD